MSTKRVLAIHDLCSFGRCSLTAAIPVISALGSQVCPFPTALFSNNLTYGTFKSTDLSATMPDMMAAWSKLNLTYDAVYSGFLAGPDQAETVKKAVLQFGKGGLSIIDPAMADNGKLYPVFDESMIKAMKSLITVADLITPTIRKPPFSLIRKSISPPHLRPNQSLKCVKHYQLTVRSESLSPAYRHETALKISATTLPQLPSMRQSPIRWISALAVPAISLRPHLRGCY